MSEAENLIRRRGWPYSDLVSRAQSSPASSVQFPLVPSHSEGASRILLTTPKRIEFDPTYRKQTTELLSERNKNAFLTSSSVQLRASSNPRPFSIHEATRNDSRKLATATKHHANHFLLATKSHVSEVLCRASSLPHPASRPWSPSSGIPARRKLDRSPGTGLPGFRTLLDTRSNTKRQSQIRNCNKTPCKPFFARYKIACFWSVVSSFEPPASSL
jgi:hypothetical protein